MEWPIEWSTPGVSDAVIRRVTNALGWAVLWWLLAGWNEASAQLPSGQEYGAVLLWMSAGALALEALANLAGI